MVEESLITENASDIFVFINRNSSIDTNNLNSINRLKIYLGGSWRVIRDSLND